MQYKLTEERTLLARVGACAASLQVPEPLGWAYQHAWQLAAQPGWVDAYASAVTGGIPDPGADEAVITDGMILAAVQQIREVTV